MFFSCSSAPVAMFNPSRIVAPPDKHSTDTLMPVALARFVFRAELTYLMESLAHFSNSEIFFASSPGGGDVSLIKCSRQRAGTLQERRRGMPLRRALLK